MKFGSHVCFLIAGNRFVAAITAKLFGSFAQLRKRWRLIYDLTFPAAFSRRVARSYARTMSATRTMLPMAVAVIACLKLASAQIPRPDTVFVPVPFDQLANVRWTGDPDRAISTCGTFRAYSGTVRKVGKKKGKNRSNRSFPQTEISWPSDCAEFVYLCGETCTGGGASYPSVSTTKAPQKEKNSKSNPRRATYMSKRVDSTVLQHFRRIGRWMKS